MAEEQKDKATEKQKDKHKDKTKNEQAWEAKVEDNSGRDWSKPRSFKPNGTV